MLRSKKTVKMKLSKYKNGKVSYTSLGEAKDKEDQKKYEDKVNKLLVCCANFEKMLLSIDSDFTADKIEGLFKVCFKGIMKRMFSRTSKILNKMDKDLKNLKEKSLADEGVVTSIKKAFNYKSEAQE